MANIKKTIKTKPTFSKTEFLNLKIMQGLKASKKGAVVKALFGKDFQPPVEKKFSKSQIRELKLRLQLERERNRFKKQQVVRQPVSSPEKDRFDSMFSNFKNPRFDRAGQVEREISGFNGQNFGNSGSNIAKAMEGQIMNFATISKRFNNNPVADIEREVMLHATLPNLNVVDDISNQVDFFADVLSDKKKKRRRKS